MTESETHGEPGSSSSRSFRGVGQRELDSPVVCVMTRFEFRQSRHRRQTIRDYERIIAETKASRTPGFLHSAFLTEDDRTCLSLSFWEHAEAIPWFGTNVPSHVEAARRAFARITYDPSRGPGLWSTKWQLMAVSNNLNWGGI